MRFARTNPKSISARRLYRKINTTFPFFFFFFSFYRRLNYRTKCQELKSPDTIQRPFKSPTGVYVLAFQMTKINKEGKKSSSPFKFFPSSTFEKVFTAVFPKSFRKFERRAANLPCRSSPFCHRSKSWYAFTFENFDEYLKWGALRHMTSSLFSKILNQIYQVLMKNSSADVFQTLPSFFHSEKNLWRRKCVRREIFRNIEVGVESRFVRFNPYLFAIPPLGHYATCMGSRYPKN